MRTRQAVLVAAAEVIGERGYEAATIAEIIQRAKVTKGALYFHFPSKDALARAVIAEQTEMLVPPPSDSRIQDVIDFSHQVARALREDPVLQAGTRIAVETTFSHQPMVPYQDWIEIVTRMFTDARERGELLPAVNPAKAAEFVVSAYMGVQLFSHAAANRADLHERVTSLWRHVLPSLTPPGAMSHLTPSGRWERHAA
ncbi:ScbR family autoregulator-binding transcription factor [Streptomyces sp. NPDC050315]|uniref:ScbR family autoregulator-binding transcription factor n=1 Tax=Streptomyces sp. NPDC050315 TaxID=3155039 RepID=UPI003447B432